MILLCRAMYKSISKRHTEKIPGIVIFPVFLVLASITWPLCLLALFVLTIKELDNEQNNYDQRDL